MPLDDALFGSILIGNFWLLLFRLNKKLKCFIAHKLWHVLAHSGDFLHAPEHLAELGKNRCFSILENAQDLKCKYDSFAAADYSRAAP